MRVILFGGTFNPIHNGHIKLAQKIYNDFNADKFYLIPAKIPPHKNMGLVPADMRFEMVKLAVECCLDGNFEVSDYELKKDGVSYTYDTLTYFRGIYPEDELYFLTGSDIFATIENWQKWENLFDLANFIVANRKEMPFNDMLKVIPSKLLEKIVDFDNFKGSKYGKIILYKMKEIPIASMYIREKFKNGTISDCLPTVVLDYINKYQLYQEV